MKKYFKNIYKKKPQELYKEIEQKLKEERKTFIITANAEIMMNTEGDKEVSKMLLDKNNIIVPDGISIVKAAKNYNINIPERITGIDLTIKLLEISDKYQKKVYLYGATEEVLTKLINELKNKYPNINIVGYCNGYAKDKDNIFDKIKLLNPDVVLVALGVPLQEKLIYKHLKDFNKGIFIGVGGTFDVLSGTKKRAPKIFIKLNLEWLYRIIKEPKRIVRFYKYNIKFLRKTKKNK